MSIDKHELLTSAREYFRKGHYTVAEPMLEQLLILEDRNPELHYMYGTIQYDQGKLKKAIATFKRALEIDPGFTDAGVGLSIILNDLGRYEEARTVFEESYAIMKQKDTQASPYVNEKLAKKHVELGDMYYLYSRFSEGLGEFKKAQELSKNNVTIGLQVVHGYQEVGQIDVSIDELKTMSLQFPADSRVKLKLSQVYLQNGQSALAQETLYEILLLEPDNAEAKKQQELIGNELNTFVEAPAKEFPWNV